MTREASAATAPGGRDAVVVGAGIGGAAAALALARRGWRVTVLERAPVIAEIGAGLQMSPNASRCLRHLGVLDAVAGHAFRPRNAVLRNGRSGRVVFAAPLGEAAVARWGAPYLHIHRADLLAALLDAAQALGVRVTPGATVVECRQTDAQLGARYRRADGGMADTGPAGLLVIADGVRSTLRDAVAGPAEPRFTGQVAWRATLPTSALPAGLIAPDATVWAGPGRHLVSYYLRGGDLLNLVAVEETPDWVEEGWAVPGEAGRLRALFRGWHPALTTVLDRVEAPLRWGLFERPDPARWAHGGAVLLGDACHPMLPFMAQGAAMAIEDAVVLAACLDRAPVAAALGAYEALRRPRTARVQAMSRANATLFHAAGVARSLRHGAIGLVTRALPGVAAGRLDWLYGHDALAAVDGVEEIGMTHWSDGMKDTPFWHEAAPPLAPSGRAAPGEVDVAVVGAGYTGLSCALALAAAGRRVAVFEAGAPGAGASTRNGGMIGWGHRASIARLARAHGAAAATAMLAEARQSLDYTLALIGRLPGETHHRRTGRFLGAGSPRHFAGLTAWARSEAPLLGMQVEIVPRAEQHRFVASDLYHGGLHFPQHGALHPALFHRALLDVAVSAGVEVIDHCPVVRLRGERGAWRVCHASGETRAADLVYAGNGHAGGPHGPFPDIARRLVPIPSTIVATVPLGPNRIASLFPGGRMIVETRATHAYFRPDPLGERILFGGRASLNILPERESARRLRDMMLSVFPDLGDVSLSHSWKGFVAFTFDGVPHAGQLGGVWHACGYNGSGVAMAPYLGWKVAARILGMAEGASGFDRAPFRAQALYRGNPWFLSVIEVWMRLKDRYEGVAAIRRRS